MELKDIVDELADQVGILAGTMRGLRNGVKGLTERVERIERDALTPILSAARRMGERAAETMDTQTAETIMKWDGKQPEVVFHEKPSVKTREDAEKVCVFWGVNDPETLTCEDSGEAIADHLESLKRSEWPETVSLHGFVRMKVKWPLASGPLSYMLETLGDEYMDESRIGPPKKTPAMKAAEETFIAAVLAEYQPWACEEVWQEDVDVMAWVKEDCRE